MHKPSIQDLVYQKCIPRPKQNEPASFYAHVQRNLVPEVRVEVQNFFGSLEELEAQYPGLDYTFPPHRRRLARYPWHRRLFRAFDELRLTDSEIFALCQWEGTRAAREKYIKETKAEIPDHTFRDIPPLVKGGGPRAIFYHYQNGSTQTGGYTKEEYMAEEDSELTEDEDEDLYISRSVGKELNERLYRAAEARMRGEPAVIDGQFEQWMKEALERNELDLDTALATFNQGGSPYFSPSPSPEHATETITPADMVSSNTSGSQPHVTFDRIQTMLHDLRSANDQLAAGNPALSMMSSRSQTAPAS